MVATLASALGCMMAAGRPAAAQVQASDLSGRWSRLLVAAGSKIPCRGADCHRTYDLMRCGDGWCGVEVKNGKDCGHVALRLDAGAATSSGVAFSGRFEIAQGSDPYTVTATLSAHPEGPLLLSLHGNTENGLQPLRRTFSPLSMVLKRDGEPACRADPAVTTAPASSRHGKAA